MRNRETKIVTRFAPSPTGLLHCGSYRTALFSYLYARQNNGKFILRIEDTDKVRSKKEYEENIIESLKWIGLEYDEFYRQSDNLPIHQKYLTQLIESGQAYISKEPARGKDGMPVLNEDGKEKMTEVVRFKNPGGKVKFHDLIRGDIEMDTTELRDFVIAKNLNEPLFHLAVVVDDFTEGITHVIRGEDHISNTPRQILIARAIGAPEPIYAHLPLILAEDRTKLSKRKGALAVTEYRDRGFLPEAVLNYMALLGWNPGTEQEIMSLPELVEKFDITKIQKGGAIFTEVKLRWINKEYLKQKPAEYFEKIITEELSKIIPNPTPDIVKKIVPLISERIETVEDIKTLFTAGEFIYLFQRPVFNTETVKGLFWKDEKDPVLTSTRLTRASELLTTLSESNFTQGKIKEVLWSYAEEQGKGSVLWPVRFALSGAQKSPDPFTLAELLGKKETLERLKQAILILK